MEKLDFEYQSTAKIRIVRADARTAMQKIKTESIDFILHHPPYSDIIKYSHGEIPEDLSSIHDIELFCNEMEIIAYECFRILKS